VETSRPEGRFVVLSGLTGTGKTALLGELAAAGECVLDLERLACHRGSAIGGIGMPPQPSHHEFQQRLVAFMASADHARPIWIEDEGPYLGSVGLPLWLQDACARAALITLETPVEVRIAQLVRLYECEDRHAVAAAVRSLGRRVGIRRAAEAADLIVSGEWPSAVEMLLPFYDTAYEHRNASKRRPVIATFSSATPPPAQAVIALQRAHAEDRGYV
jgi:tRNA 2-selenouridine synthase